MHASEGNERERAAPREEAFGQVPVELYRTLVDSVQDYAIFALDPTGRIRTWNPGAQRLKGYRAHEIVGRHFSAFYSDLDVARGKPSQELLIAAEYGRFEDEGWRIRMDGTRFWANVIITAMRDETGLLLGFSKVTRDLTERKRSEEALRVAYEDMESFATAAGHDLRAPLRGVHALADATLQDHPDGLPEDARRNLEAIRKSAAKASKLVDDLLRFSRGASGPLQKERVDLGVLAQETAAGLRGRFPHPVAFDVQEDADLVVEGDCDLLRIVLDNMLSNAWKYTLKAASPRVELSNAGLDEEGRVLVRVRDNGVGFDARRAGDLFEPFCRLPSARDYEGTGIGLATVRRIVERHGGRVHADSRPGEGATFTLALPRMPADEPLG